MATANTFVQIGSTVTVGSSVSSIEFTSIPATYTDLMILCSLRGDRSASENQAAAIEFNSSSSNLTARWIRVLENAAGSGSEASSIPFGVNGAANTASSFASTSIYIPNYASSNYKSFSADAVTENNATTAYAELGAFLWSDTAAITSVKISTTSTNLWKEYSTAYLYGIKSS